MLTSVAWIKRAWRSKCSLPSRWASLPNFLRTNWEVLLTPVLAHQCQSCKLPILSYMDLLPILELWVSEPWSLRLPVKMSSKSEATRLASWTSTRSLNRLLLQISLTKLRFCWKDFLPPNPRSQFIPKTRLPERKKLQCLSSLRVSRPLPMVCKKTMSSLKERH